MSRPHPLLALVALGSLGATSTCGGPDLLNDSHFDLWCGDQLCAWELEEGELERVPTWHERDFGAELVGSPVAISQLSEATSATVDCIEFRLNTDTELSAQLVLEVDFLDDDVIDVEQVVSSTEWQSLAYTITPPSWFEKIRFRLRKQGEGTAVVAQLRAIEVDEENCGAEPLDLVDRPQYATCEDDDQCTDGICAEIPVIVWTARQTALACSTCDDATDCDGDEVCGVSWAEDWTSGARTCEPPATKSLGDTCAVDGECASGICHDSQCAECQDDDDCTEGSCLQRPVPDDATDFIEEMQPHVCFTGTGTRETGEACLGDEDCASGTCQAAERVAVCELDGRPCSADRDCPEYDGGGAPVCLDFAERDGVCL